MTTFAANLWTAPPPVKMPLRPFQQDALDGAFEQWEDHQSTLVVLPTGTGKTIMFAHVIKRMPPGRVMVVAHRDELIRQAADKIYRVTEEQPDIEMAQEWAAHDTRIIVSSVQTQNAGNDGKGRMARFDPDDFTLLIIDEAHHGTAKTYRRVIDHYTKNPNLKVLGVTATPDRADEEALGQVFTSVGFDYEINDAIDDGWLVPITQHSILIEDLDLSQCKVTAGDLNQGDLAKAMEYEKPLLGIADATFTEARSRKTLLFASSVAHAERISEIFNRYEKGCARWVCGKTDKAVRRRLVKEYEAGAFQILCNVGVATEGFDEPGIECVAVARPTMSRALYAQMVGRGTRPLTGIVDGLDSALERNAAIAASAKPQLEVFDFVGNAGRHRLMSCADILGGRHSDEVVERAARIVREKGEAANVQEAIEEASEQVGKEHEEEKRRAAIKAKAKYRTVKVNPFDVFGIEPVRERAWDTKRQPSDKMLAMLKRNGIEPPEDLTFDQARQLVQKIIARREHGWCSFKQAALLQRYGYATRGLRFEEASKLITQLKDNGWKRLDVLPEDAPF